MLDCVLKGGTVVDGTGRPKFEADVGIVDGHIVEIGAVEGLAARSIDASGLVVAPGFVDIHTHYDAQLAWDPVASPSSLHGVTTVVGGNCGFGVAPLGGDDDAEYVASLLAVVEGIPRTSLDAGLDWRWSSFASWLDRFEGHLGVNAAFLVGHSVLRRVVMGADAVGGRASDQQVGAMARLLHESLDAGGIGFSSSWAPTHVDASAQPVPSRAASLDELVALAAATGRHPGTTLAFIPGLAPFTPTEADAMSKMLAAADRPLNWNTFRLNDDDVAGAEARLESATPAASDARVLALTYPAPVEILFGFLHAAPLVGLPGWSETMQLPVGERLRSLDDPATRARLEMGAATAKGQLANLSDWASLQVAGRQVADVAVERGRSPFDVVLDIAVASDLRTVFSVPPVGDDPATWAARSRYWGDPRTIVGGSDAGAHLDALCASRYTADLIGPSVRERGLLSLELAVRLLTDDPARLLGLDGRGRVAVGAWADLVVFDPDRIGPGPISTRADLPGGASRLHSEPLGIECVLVNGRVVVEGNRFTGDLPGAVLRSGLATSTVTVR